MPDLIDFEDIIHLNEVCAQKENDNPSQNSHEPLSAVLDQLCETLDVDRIALSAENFDKRPHVLISSPQLDEIEEILNDACVLKDNTKEKIENNQIEKLEQNKKTFTPFGFDDIKDVVEDTGMLYEKQDKIVNEHTGKVDEEQIGLSPTTIGLAEFHKIYNATCLSNDNLNKGKSGDNFVKTNHAENTNISENSIKMFEEFDEKKSYDTIINLDEFDIVNEKDINLKNKETSTNDIKISETEQNANAATLLYPVIDDTETSTNNNKNINDVGCKDENDNIKHVDVTKPNDVPAIKEDIKDRERLHGFKTVNLDVTNDDIISVSSTDSDDGYNSSDFEFISESEAKKSLTVNGTNNMTLHAPNTKQTAVTFGSDPDYIKYHRNRYIRCNAALAKADRESHVIPEGDGFLNLFRGIHCPMFMGGLYSMNKIVLPAKSMTFNTDGFGFDLPANREETPEFKNEAVDTANKIRFLYPDENRKRRRL